MSEIRTKVRGLRVREKAARFRGKCAVEVTPEAEGQKSEPFSLRPSPPSAGGQMVTDLIAARQSLLLLVSSPLWKSRKLSLKGLKEIDASAFNEEAERMFLELCAAGSGLSARDIIAAAANALDISTETAKRYLAKHSAIGGALRIDGGKVVQDV